MPLLKAQAQVKKKINWADLLEAAGRYTIPLSEFWAMTPFEFHHYSIGYEYNHRQAWEIARYNATLVMMPHLKKGSKLSPRDLSLLPWELEVSPIEITPEQHAANLEEFDKVYQAILDGSAKLVPVKSEKELK